MNEKELIEKLKTLGIHTEEAYFSEAFNRNIGLLTKEEQKRVANATIALPGMGGVGGLHLITLVRTGFTRFHLADFDVFEPVNVNRQFGASVPAFGKPKLEVMKKIALKINPFLEIREFPEGITEENLDDFLENVDIVIDGLDYFSFDMRRILFTRAQEKGAYVITAGPMGFSSAMLIFSPYRGMTFDEYFNIVENMPEEEKHLAYGLGLSPRPTHIRYMDLSKVDLSKKAGPSSAIACQLCAGMACAEALKIVVGRGKVKPVPHYFQFDPYLLKFRKGELYMGNRNPLQRLKMKAVKILLRRRKNVMEETIPVASAVKVKDKKIPSEIMQFLIRSGIQAPSGDNCQPWYFSYNGDTINLFLDRNADTSFFNVHQIASTISCGAVIENIRVAATRFGLATAISYLPDPCDKDLMASLKLFPVDTEADPLFDAIWKRHTNRKFYKKRHFPNFIFRELETTLTGFEGVKLSLITDRKKLKSLAKLIYRVDRIRTEHRPLHEHLVQMIRFTKKEATEKRYGFPIQNLEAGLAGNIFLWLTRPWWVMNLVNKMGLGRMVALHSYQAMVKCSAAGLLTVPEMDRTNFLEGGQALERIWLTLTRYGLAMQPMTAITLFWLRWQMDGEADFLPAHRRLLREVWQDYRKLFPDVDFSKEGHVMLFRMGYAPPITHRTYRKSVQNFLT